MGQNEVGWGIKVEEMMEDQWSLGMCISHWWEETYLFINFFKWSISIGKISKPVEDDDYYD